MKMDALLLVTVLTLLPGCEHGSRECRSQTQYLRTRLAAIDWSLVHVTPEFAYERVPIAGGGEIPGPRPIFSMTVAIDGTRVELLEQVHPAGEPLGDWLVRRGHLHSDVMREKRDPEKPLYLLATQDTRLAIVRTAVQALQSLTIVHVAVRPERTQAHPWLPSKRGRLLFEQVTHKGPQEDSFEWQARFTRANEAPAVGCSEALDLVMRYGLHSYERLQRLPDAFEQCGCGGDMDTLAAFLWRQSIEDDMKPVRWHPWDEELVQRLGDDATYADLIQAILAKTPGTKGPH